MKELSKLFILALKQLKQYRHYHLGSHQVFTSKNFQTCYHDEANFRVQD